MYFFLAYFINLIGVRLSELRLIFGSDLMVFCPKSKLCCKFTIYIFGLVVLNLVLLLLKKSGNYITNLSRLNFTRIILSKVLLPRIILYFCNYNRKNRILFE